MIQNKKLYFPSLYDFFPKNRKGDTMFSLYWFAILLIVAGGIILMVFVFYGNPYDVREIEANLLVDKIATCVSYGGKINSSLISDGKVQSIDTLDNCHLNLSEEYFYEITFYKVEDMVNPFLKTQGGNLNLAASCAITDEDSSNLPKCINRSFYSIDNANNQYIIEILTAIKKTEQNV
ncbi:hypothetical protein M0R72_05090 [Candidatus Pacearchaeota archaeon]|nr:hypothetical protein [Candidatus Pacearchaeota archaeon]